MMYIQYSCMKFSKHNNNNVILNDLNNKLKMDTCQNLLDKRKVPNCILFRKDILNSKYK